MVARCDGEHLGEMVVLQLSKQELIFGPMQIAARINQDQNISKDLTLWNQQGSQVLRGQMLVLPVGNTFLYVDPIYIQATEARMPQLKKVVLAVGNRLIYADTYDRRCRSSRRRAASQSSRPTAPGRSAAGTAGARPAARLPIRASARPRPSAPLSRAGRAGQMVRSRQGTGSDRGRGQTVAARVTRPRARSRPRRRSLPPPP